MSSSNTYPRAGGCDCEDIRYRLECPPLFVHCCHCRWCQRETGASFALNALIEADRVTQLGGWTIAWPNGADIAPEALYECAEVSNERGAA